MKYLVVECTELGDQWECDADRTPICLTDDYSKYNKMGYEIYEVKSDGTFELIRNYYEVTNESIYVYIWDNIDNANHGKYPTTFAKITSGNRHDVTKSMVKKIKQQYGFTDTIDEIFKDIQCSGTHGERHKNKWMEFGEVFDNEFYFGI